MKSPDSARKLFPSRVTIRPPTRGDCRAFLCAVRRRRALHHPWVSPPTTPKAFCGFVREGFSRRYLKVCGRWADHERWAILAEDFRKQCPHPEL
jgi:hypothetical protein